MRKIIYLIVLFLLIGSIYSIASKIELPDFDFDDVEEPEEVETKEPNDSNEPSSPEDTTETDSPSDTDESTETEEPPETECAHVYNDGFVLIKATCSHNGTMKYTCELCGHVKKTVIPKTEHDIQGSGDVGFDSKEPCLSYWYSYCCNCDYESEKEYYYAHSYGDNGHCTKEGCNAFDASYCKHPSRKNGICESCGWTDPDWEDPQECTHENITLEGDCCLGKNYCVDCGFIVDSWIGDQDGDGFCDNCGGSQD